MISIRPDTGMCFATFEKQPIAVNPAKAGVQKALKRLNAGFRRHDDSSDSDRN
jgi:hypothetical protein